LVLGVDLSSRMLQRARQRAAEQGIANASFLQADAQIHPFEPQAFDLAISRTGAMYFGDPMAAFTNIARALRPGGRLALLAWQAEPDNLWSVELDQALAAGRALPAAPLDAPGPFSLADPDRVRSILRVPSSPPSPSKGIREPLGFGADAEDAYRFVFGMGFARSMLQGLDREGRERALEALRATLVAHDTGNGVLYPSAAWIIGACRPVREEDPAHV
jgi:SAM-dependent methyltransferase